MLYLICFNLHNLNEDVYTDFFNAIDDTGKNQMLWDSVFLVDTVLTAEGIRKGLLPHIADNDKLMIVKMNKGECAGKLSDKQKQFVSYYMEINSKGQEKPLGFSSLPVPPRKVNPFEFSE